jgi:hypothetical protein
MSTTSGHAAHLDALQLSKAVRRRLVEFSSDDRYSRDPKLSHICRDIWTGRPSDGGLLSDLWVEGAFPAKLSNATLATLAEAGSFDTYKGRFSYGEKFKSGVEFLLSGSYYTSAGLYLPLTRSPTPDAGERSEAQLYWSLLQGALVPRFLVLEASVNPLPCLGVAVHEWRAAYDGAQVTSDLNLVRALTAGRARPWTNEELLALIGGR